MDQFEQVEQEVRAELGRAVDSTPLLPGLADRVIRGGRRRRRVRTAAAAGLVVATVALAGVQLTPALRDRAWTSPATPTGPPAVPLVVDQGPADQESGVLLDWDGGGLRSRSIGPAQAIGVVPAGVLLVTGGPQAHLDLLAGDATTPRPLIRGLASTVVAVAPAGDRVTVVTGTGPQRRLREIEVPSGREQRAVSVGPPLVETAEPLAPVSYSADAVLLTVGEGRTRRTAQWEAGDDEVIGTLSGFSAVLGGAVDRPGSPTGRAAFSVTDSRCREAVARLRNGTPSWPLCGEHFGGFSPDGHRVLAARTGNDAVVVHDADDGDTEQVLPAPAGVRSYGWESDDTVLYTTVAANTTVVIRCAVRSGDCRTATTWPGTDRIPQPLERFED